MKLVLNKRRGKNKFSIKTDPTVKEEVMINGNEAVAFGAIAGGCNFISAYPMSPSTGVLTVLAKYSSEFGIVIDQAEDEIAAINKVIGAWYAGEKRSCINIGWRICINDLKEFLWQE
jgi:2-oxoglutarate ferredoxin oxidoreductase subunit alpha